MSEAIEEGSCREHDEIERDELPEVAEVAGSEAMFHELIGPAREIPADRVVVFKANASIVFHNVERGVRAIEPHREAIERLPGIDARRILALPKLALALAYAQALVERAARPQGAGETRTKLSRAASLRRIFLRSLEACAEAGLISKAELRPIRSGSGPIDLAGDLVACLALFRKHEAALNGKTPVSPETLREASEVAADLHKTLKPAGTPTPKSPRKVDELRDDRNRLWTLLLDGHSDLRKAAAFIWGDEASKHVPALQSRARVTPEPSPPAA